jgi:hypothetical protein
VIGREGGRGDSYSVPATSFLGLNSSRDEDFTCPRKKETNEERAKEGRNEGGRERGACRNGRGGSYISAYAYIYKIRHVYVCM